MEEGDVKEKVPGTLALPPDRVELDNCCPYVIALADGGVVTVVATGSGSRTRIVAVTVTGR